MEQLNWKIEKIKSLTDEVKQLHPVLHALFQAIPQIKSVKYTQGSRENGADFVLVKTDSLLDQDEYIGVVVKSSSIRQNSDDVHRQIKECTLAPRPIENGKKSIFLTEIWVVTSQEITRNAEDFLNLEYKTTKIKFIDCHQLAALVDKYFSRYWDFSDASLSNYIANQKSNLTTIKKLHSLLPSDFGHISIDHEIQRISDEYKKGFKPSKAKPTKLWDEIQKKKLVFIEGGMGSGKSDLLLSTALKLCEKDIVNEWNYVPYFTKYRDLIKNPDYCSNEFIDSIHSSIGDKNKKAVIFIDGLDESQESNAIKVKEMCEFANLLNTRNDTLLVVASRSIDEASLSADISKSFDKYHVCQLTYGTVINIVQRICEKSSVSNKLKDDLQNSTLLRALPKTPLSAILLGKLLKENIHELPSTLPELYSKYVELVLGRWDLKKGNGSEKEYETLQRLISKVAIYFIDHDLDSLGINELKKMFASYLDERRTGQSLEPMLTSFLKKSELISFDTDNEIIRFRHKTFSEYFYAHALFVEKGKDAPIKSPFDQNWFGIEYFYMGLVRDTPDRIEKLSAYIPDGPAEEFVKLAHLGSFLMAGYQTPYEKIQDAVYRTFKDATNLYSKAIVGDQTQWLAQLPELQVLALITQIMRHAYAYDFFRPALVSARLEAELDDGLEENEKIVLIFLADAVLSTLQDQSAFEALVDRHETQLSWTIRLGIYNATQDITYINEATKRVGKKIDKSIKNNQGLISYLTALESTPIVDRKDIKKID